MAYQIACKEDTVEVFHARMNLVGHHEAGMTSLVTRLMGQDLKEDVQSTESISIQLLKSAFNMNEKKMGKWSETTLDSSSYMKDFSHAVLSRVKSIKLRKRRALRNKKYHHQTKMSPTQKVALTYKNLEKKIRINQRNLQQIV